MMYGKLIDGELRGAPRPIKTADGDVFTTDPNLLLQYGYKLIILTEYPSDGKSYVDSWAETETEITQVWTEQPQNDDDPISDSEALEIITGGDSA
jgi:hypothetical protein|nr:MAG TPA_asm: hypothetical protein [Caudoviricetes sp.]